MRKLFYSILVIFSVSIIWSGITDSFGKNPKIPSWIKITAGFWVDDQISDEEFISALQFLIDKGILQVSNPDISLPHTSNDISEIKEPGESNRQFEEDYQRDATTVGKTITQGNFKVTLDKVGHFKHKMLWDVKEHFRLDLTVTNVGDEVKLLLLDSLAVLDSNSNQYDYIPIGLFEDGALDNGKKIRPGVTKNGFVLIEPLPKNIKNITVAFDLGYDRNFNDYTFEYNVSLKW